MYHKKQVAQRFDINKITNQIAQRLNIKNIKLDGVSHCEDYMEFYVEDKFYSIKFDNQNNIISMENFPSLGLGCGMNRG